MIYILCEKNLYTTEEKTQVQATTGLVSVFYLWGRGPTNVKRRQSYRQVRGGPGGNALVRSSGSAGKKQSYTPSNIVISNSAPLIGLGLPGYMND